MADTPGFQLPEVQNYEWALLNNKATSQLGVGMVGFAGLSALGTPSTIPIFTSPTTIGNSVWSDDGSALRTASRGIWIGGNPNIDWGAPADIFVFDTSSGDKNGTITVWLVGDPANNGQKFWLWGSEVDSKAGNSHAIAQLSGSYWIVNHQGSGTVTESVALNGSINNSSTGTITLAEGILINAATNTGGGAITTNYGLKIEAQTAGTTNWDIYTGPAVASFNSHLATDWTGFLGQNFFGAINPPQQYAAFFVGQSSTGAVSGLASLSYSSTNTHPSTAGEFYATALHTSGTMAFASSVFTSTTNQSTGTVTDLIGVQAGGNSNLGGGTVTNNYGIFVNNQTAGTNNYAIFTNTGLVSFGDQVNVRSGTVNIVTGGSTTISTGVGSVKMSTANAATNAAWIPFKYNGTTYFVPAWTTNAP